MNRKLLVAAIIGACWLLIAPFLFTQWEVARVTFASREYTAFRPGSLFSLLATNPSEGLGVWLALPLQANLFGALEAVATGTRTFFEAFFLTEAVFVTMASWAIAGFLISTIGKTPKYTIALGGLLLGLLVLGQVVCALVVALPVVLPWSGILLAGLLLLLGWGIGSLIVLRTHQ